MSDFRPPYGPGRPWFGVCWARGCRPFAAWLLGPPHRHASGTAGLRLFRIQFEFRWHMPSRAWTESWSAPAGTFHDA